MSEGLKVGLAFYFVVVGAFVAFKVMDIMEHLAAVNITYAYTGRFAYIGMGRGQNAVVFDSATGEVTFRPLPKPESLDEEEK